MASSGPGEIVDGLAAAAPAARPLASAGDEAMSASLELSTCGGAAPRASRNAGDSAYRDVARAGPDGARVVPGPTRPDLIREGGGRAAGDSRGSVTCPRSAHIEGA